MSYANAILYISTLPTYSNDKKKDDFGYDASKDANNPELFNQKSDRKITDIRQMIK